MTLNPDTLAVMVARVAAARALVDKCPMDIVPATRSEYYECSKHPPSVWKITNTSKI